ncbi:MAG: response regulator [Candidatus Thermoplasmatota archaeon]
MVKIMVVDDDSDVVTSIKLGLNRLSKRYEVIGATNGEECFELLNRGLDPDLIILDIMMPGMDGWEVFDELKNSNDWVDIPIIFLTALNDRETLKKGMETNTYCIKKPFEINDLKDKIERVLSGDSFF